MQLLRLALVFFTLAQVVHAELIEFGDKDAAEKIAALAQQVVPINAENKVAYQVLTSRLSTMLRENRQMMEQAGQRDPKTMQWEVVVAKFINHVHGQDAVYGKTPATDAMLNAVIRNSKEFSKARRKPYPASEMLRVISAAEATGRAALRETVREMYIDAFESQTKAYKPPATSREMSPELGRTVDLFRSVTSKGIQPPPVSDAELSRILMEAVHAEAQIKKSNPMTLMNTFWESMRQPNHPESRMKDSSFQTKEEMMVEAFNSLFTKRPPNKEVFMTAMKITQEPSVKGTRLGQRLDRVVYAVVQMNDLSKKLEKDTTWDAVKKRVEYQPGAKYLAIELARQKFAEPTPGVPPEILASGMPEHLKEKPLTTIQQWKEYVWALTLENQGQSDLANILSEISLVSYTTDTNLGNDIVKKLTSLLKSGKYKEASLASLLETMLPKISSLRASAVEIHELIRVLEQKSVQDQGLVFDKARALCYEWGFANARNYMEFASLSSSLFGEASGRAPFGREVLGRVLAKALGSPVQERNQGVADNLAFVLRQVQDGKETKYRTFNSRWGESFNQRQWLEAAADHIRSSKDVKMLDALLNLFPSGTNPTQLKPEDRLLLERALHEAITNHSENAELKTRKNYEALAKRVLAASPSTAGGAGGGGGSAGRMIRDTGNPMDTMMRPASARSRHDQPNPCPLGLLK